MSTVDVQMKKNDATFVVDCPHRHPMECLVPPGLPAGASFDVTLHCEKCERAERECKYDAHVTVA